MDDPTLAGLWEVARDHIHQHPDNFYSDPLNMSDTAFAGMYSSYDWRAYVPHTIQEAWAHLTERERLLVALVAADAAHEALSHAD
jgi:hypothetical protein